MQSNILYAGNGLDNVILNKTQKSINRLILNPLAKTFINSKGQIRGKEFSLNPLAEMFILHSASKAVGVDCHAVINSIPYSTGDTEVSASSSYFNLGATPKRGDINSKSQSIICINNNISESGEVNLVKHENGSCSKVSSESKNRSTSDIECFDNSVICELTQTKNSSNSVHENKIELLIFKFRRQFGV